MQAKRTAKWKWISLAISAALCIGMVGGCFWLEDSIPKPKLEFLSNAVVVDEPLYISDGKWVSSSYLTQEPIDQVSTRARREIGPCKITTVAEPRSITLTAPQIEVTLRVGRFDNRPNDGYVRIHVVEKRSLTFHEWVRAMTQ